MAAAPIALAIVPAAEISNCHLEGLGVAFRESGSSGVDLSKNLERMGYS